MPLNRSVPSPDLTLRLTALSASQAKKCQPELAKFRIPFYTRNLKDRESELAERVPIWYQVNDGQQLPVEARPHLQSIAAQLHRELNLCIAIAYADDEGGEIRCAASSGPAAPIIGTSLNLQGGICAACVRQNRLQLSHDTAADPMVSRQLCQRLGIRSILAVPLRRGTKCLGFLAAFSDVADRFDLALIERIRNEAAKIEEHLTPITSPRCNFLSDLATPEATRSEAVVPLFGDYAREQYLAADRRNLAVTFTSPLSIATVASCALLMITLVPSVIRYKASPNSPAARTEEASIQVRNAAVTHADPTTSADDPTLRRLREQADVGDVRAQVSLATRYEKGASVPRDPLKASVWYIIAGANGELTAKLQAVRL